MIVFLKDIITKEGVVSREITNIMDKESEKIYFYFKKTEHLKP